MKVDRVQLKTEARACMADAVPSARLVTFVYVLLTTVLTGVIESVMGSPFQGAVEMIAQGYDPEWVLYSALSGPLLPIIIFVSILLSLYVMVMNFGYIAYCLRLSRRDRSAGIGTLLEGFSMVGKVILTNILVAVFSALWCIALAIPLAIVVGVVTVLAGDVVAVIITVVAFIAYYIAVIAVVLRYVLADYALLEDPEAGCLAAIRTSKELMRGRRLEYVVLCLSFLGWLILVAILGGIGGAIGAGIGYFTGSATVTSLLSTVLSLLVSLPLSLWLSPYMGCTLAGWYNALSGFSGREDHNPAGDFPYL